MDEKIYLEILAQIAGWTYFIVWTISFYPQVYLNWKRKSVVGLSFDFLALNITGFLMYSIYTVVVFCDRDMQSYFRKENGATSKDDPVKLNDVVFATHGLTVCLFQLGQVMIYDRGNQRLTKWIGVVCVLAFLGLGVFGVVAAFYNTAAMWVSVLTYAGYIKSASAFSKVLPQIYLNYKRKSTDGWSIEGIWMDFTGGVLSAVQMLLYCVIDGDNTQLTGNIPKLLLSCEALTIDTVFVVQHYILYPVRSRGVVDDHAGGDHEKKPLIVHISSLQYNSV